MKDDQEQSYRATRSEDAILDRQLDAALAKYSAAEPRAGLEDRILANLRAERTHAPVRSWLRWGTAGAFAAVAIALAVMVLRSTHPSAPVTHRPFIETPAPKQQQQRVATNAGKSIAPQRRSVKARPDHPAVATAAPKLDVFPSPQPLTEEEKMLVGYIVQNPEEAALVAEARTVWLQAEAEERLRLETEDQRTRQ